MASNRAESFGLIDEIRIVAENGPEGVVMSVSGKTEEPVTSTSTSPPCLIITTIGGRYLAFEAEHSQGVLTGQDWEFLHPPVVKGVLYPVVDLAVRLNLGGARQWDETEGVLLANGKCRGCVRVQKVHGILEACRSQVLPLPAQFRGPERRWYRGMILFDHSVALILNTAWVLEEQLEGEARTESQGTESVVALQGTMQSKNQTC